MTFASDVVETDEMQQWLKESKPRIKDKMTKNIDIRAYKSTETIRIGMNCMKNIMFDNLIAYNQNNVISPFQIPVILIDSAKNELWSKVDDWRGLNRFKKKPRDFKSYRINADGWWNRHKAQWIGDYFFDPLLRDTLPDYIQNIIGCDQNNPIYAILYFTILQKIFNEEIAFARTKYMPLICPQSFLHNNCKKTLQALFKKLGHQYSVQWNNDKIKKGEEAHKYAKKWVKEVLEKIQLAHNKRTTLDLKRLRDRNNNNGDDMKYNDILPPVTTSSNICGCNYHYGDNDGMPSVYNQHVINMDVFKYVQHSQYNNMNTSMMAKESMYRRQNASKPLPYKMRQNPYPEYNDTYHIQSVSQPQINTNNGYISDTFNDIHCNQIQPQYPNISGIHSSNTMDTSNNHQSQHSSLSVSFNPNTINNHIIKEPVIYNQNINTNHVRIYQSQIYHPGVNNNHQSQRNVPFQSQNPSIASIQINNNNNNNNNNDNHQIQMKPPTVYNQKPLRPFRERTASSSYNQYTHYIQSQSVSMPHPRPNINGPRIYTPRKSQLSIYNECNNNNNNNNNNNHNNNNNDNHSLPSMVSLPSLSTETNNNDNSMAPSISYTTSGYNDNCSESIFERGIEPQIRSIFNNSMDIPLNIPINDSPMFGMDNFDNTD